MWQMLHYIAIGYPDEPDFATRGAYRSFFVNLGAVLPCHVCAENYARHLSELPIDAYLDGGSKRLFEWTVLLHNIVNVENGKPPVQDIDALYDSYVQTRSRTSSSNSSTSTSKPTISTSPCDGGIEGKVANAALNVDPFAPIVVTCFMLLCIVVGGLIVYSTLARRR